MPLPSLSLPADHELPDYPPDHSVAATAVNALFRDLRRRGFLAKQRFMCCRTCARDAIMREMTPAHRGYVFYHRQDDEGAWTRSLDGAKVIGGPLYLAFDGHIGGAWTDQAAAIVGGEIVESATTLGIPIQWGGDANTRVALLPYDGFDVG